MPIEIKELVIRAVAQAEAAEPSRDAPGRDSEVDFDALVEACVRQVLRILGKAKER